MSARVGVIGGRGVVGGELAKIFARHTGVDVVFGADPAAARMSPGDVAALARGDAVGALDGLILCAPNGAARAYVDAIDALGPEGSRVKIVDVSSDYRFDDAWVYGSPERFRARIQSAARISNPGCYSTGAQLALAPLVDVIVGAPAIFGISGYSGAGSTPSPKNDPQRLADNILPYDLVNHTQEREIARHLGIAVSFMPHVASFFAGIALTMRIDLARSMTASEIVDRWRRAYDGAPLVRVHGVDEPAPEVRDARGTHLVHVGGACVSPDGTRAVLVATLDNLLKGAATQAVQNLNLALGLPELLGIA